MKIQFILRLQSLINMGEEGDGFEEVSAKDKVKDKVKDAGEQIQGTIRGLSRVVADALKESDPS